MRWFFLCSLPLLALDQLTKAAITARFQDLSSRIEVIPGFFNLVRVHNQGMAFGLGNGTPWANALFLSVATLAIGLIIYFGKRGTFQGTAAKLAVSLLVAGILGNLTDRLVRGYVVDFLDFNLGFMRWPSFNVADSCIFIAAFLLFFSSLRGAPEPE